MSQIFIDEVRAIVLSNFSDEKFGVSELSSLLGFSTSQTLRKVKNATGKSVNQYIRELRLEKAAKLIKKTDLSIAEISYQVGFSSPNYFNKVFKKYYGIAPGEYKTKSISLSELTANKPERKSPKVSLKKKIFFPVVIVFVLVIGYLLVNKTASKKTSFENSIAVLPFKDFSPEDSQWFSDGVSDNILHSLAQMKDLSVISFTSSSTFRDSDKTIPEIAKELGVSYILEGSVTLVEGKIKIIAQLINSNDEHMWSKEYNENFDDIIAIQNNVAQEVMQQLEITLSPQEEVVLTKYPTQNMEAYNLHLKGRLNDSRKKEDLLKNIELNKQAIALDSNFAVAYAEIANNYYLLQYYNAFTIESLEARNKAEFYANKALQVDPNSYKAWLVKAGLLDYVDWDKAKEYYKKAIALNPNNALSHTYFGMYLVYSPNPNIKKAFKHFKIAQQLDPLSRRVAINFFHGLVRLKGFEEAEKFLIKSKFLFSEFSYLNRECELVAYKNKDWTTIIPFLEAKIEKDPNNALLYYKLGEAYDFILNDDRTSITYHKKAYQKDSTSSLIVNEYFLVLVEGEKNKEAKKLLESKNYKSLMSKSAQLRNLWWLYYHQGNSKKVLEISKDSLFTNDYDMQSRTYAHLGYRNKLDSIHKKYPWGTGRIIDCRARRALLHAALKDRDSMYYYLENMNSLLWIGIVNSRRDMDPYRNEARYKAFLSKWYFPVPVE